MRRCAAMWATIVIVMCGWIGTAAAQPAGEVTSALQLFEGMPAELRPDAKTGWTPEQAEQASQWLMRTSMRRPCRLLLPISGTDVAHAPSPMAPGKDWRVSVYVNPPPLDVFGQRVAQKFMVAPVGIAGPLMFQMTEEASKAAKSLKTGDVVAVSGVISKARFFSVRGVSSVDVSIMNAQVDLHPGHAPAPPAADKPAEPNKPAKPADAPAHEDKPAASPVGGVITDLNQLFVNMPAGFAPDATKGWDRNSIAKAGAWVAQQAKDRPVSLHVDISILNVRPEETPDKKPNSPWIADFVAKGATLMVGKTAVNAALVGSDAKAFRIHGSEAQLSKYKPFNARQKSVTLTGVIHEAQLYAIGPNLVALKITIDKFDAPELLK
ncbi:MAG: hypothetical protein GC162_00210 [Planctomycetes bacterium]|nr:hypothetical protein [Planctomycetota bacterium]